MSKVMDLLVDNSATGRLTRVLQLQRGLTGSPAKAPIFPGSGPGSAFMLDATTAAFARRTTALASSFVQIWRTHLQTTYPNRDWHDVFLVKDALLKFHRTDKRMAEYVDFVRFDRALASQFRREHDSTWFEAQASIAAREVADIFTMARLATLSEHLRSSQHSQTHGLIWEVCFISGSNRMRSLLRLAMTAGLADGVKLIHPLAVMRFDQFLYPAVNESAAGEYSSSGRNFALDVISESKRIATDEEKGRFIDHLRDLLTTCGAAFSPQHDRSLLQIRRKLEMDTSLSLDSYVRVIRETVAKDFVKAYLLVNAIPADNGEKLSMISLPWLTLPFEVEELSSADRFVAYLHGSDSRIQDKGALASTYADVLLKLVNDDDPTGYTDMLCAALGHLARGRKSLRAAETLANSAAVLALNMPDTLEAPSLRGESYEAEGNEALYLCAFISRMSARPGNTKKLETIAWRNEHRETLKLARGRVALWSRQRRDVTEHVEVNSANLSRRSMVLMRYDIEDAVRDTFCWLFDLLLHSEPEFAHVTAADAKSLFSTLTEQIDRICEYLSALTGKDIPPALSFISAQLFMSSTQAWICSQCKVETERNVTADSIQKMTQSISRLRPLLTHDAWSSDLIRALEYIFLKHSGLQKTPRQDIASPDFNFIHFAEIDALRIPWLRQLLRADSLGPACVPALSAAALASAE
jgi:hypothetical protein